MGFCGSSVCVRVGLPEDWLSGKRRQWGKLQILLGFSVDTVPVVSPEVTSRDLVFLGPGPGVGRSFHRNPLVCSYCRPSEVRFRDETGK